jgi:hypothetical protein
VTLGVEASRFFAPAAVLVAFAAIEDLTAFAAAAAFAAGLLAGFPAFDTFRLF